MPKPQSNTPPDSEHAEPRDPQPDASEDRREQDRRSGGGDRRQSVLDRRIGADRRRVTRTGLERLRGPGRRRTDFARSAEEGEMTDEQFLFVTAINAFKVVNDKPFPTWTEVLEVIRKLGYRKTMPSELSLKNAEDWTEAPNAPSMPPKQGDDTTTDADAQDEQQILEAYEE